MNPPSKPLITPLSIVEGDILLELEHTACATLKALKKDLAYPAALLHIAVGSLIRRGLVRGVLRPDGIALETLAEAGVR